MALQDKTQKETHMIRNSIAILATTLIGAWPLPAQKADPFSAEIRQMYDHVKANLTKMVEKMPEENYSFKPAAETRTFGQIVAHVADAQARVCSAVKGVSKSLNAASKTAKAELVASLKESFSLCDQAFDSLTDATALETFALPQGQHHSKAGLLMSAIVSHSNEEYGYMAVYLRLKGIVPPSSEKSESH
jgi:uncharacterized damage-inducible protein DinB